MKPRRKRGSALKAKVLEVVCALVLMNAYGLANAQAVPLISINLLQAIDLALKQNRTLQVASLAVRDVEHKREIARSAYLPHITNDSNVQHITELAGVEIPAGTFGVHSSTGSIPGQKLFIDQGSATSYTSGTRLEQPLTQVFKIRESNRAARADVEVARIQLTQAEEAIAFKVRTLYCDLLVAQIKLQAATEEVTASEVKNLEDKNAVANGRALDVAVLESQAATLEAQQSVLTQTLTVHNLMLSLDALLGLPLNSKLQLDSSPSSLTVPIPTRDECLRTAYAQSPVILTARQTLLKAKAGLAAAKDAYIPNITGLARYSYQSGIPLLVHNFGTFGANFSYDLFDGGRRSAEVKDAKILLAEAELSLENAIDEVDVAVESAYDKVEQAKSMVKVSQQALELRTEAARLTDRQLEQNVALASSSAAAHAKLVSARASLVGATLALSLAQGDLKRTIGLMPR